MTPAKPALILEMINALNVPKDIEQALEDE